MHEDIDENFGEEYSHPWNETMGRIWQPRGPLPFLWLGTCWCTGDWSKLSAYQSHSQDRVWEEGSPEDDPYPARQIPIRDAPLPDGWRANGACARDVSFLPLPTSSSHRCRTALPAHISENAEGFRRVLSARRRETGQAWSSSCHSIR